MTIVCVCNELTVFAREGKGYTVSGPRNLLFRIYSAKAPKEITVKGKKIKKAKSGRLEENLEMILKLWRGVGIKKQVSVV